LDSRARALVVLWRLIADGNNGGLLQFLGNWGIAEMHRALVALADVKAMDTLGIVSEFWRLIGPITESDEVTTMDAWMNVERRAAAFRLQQLKDASDAHLSLATT